MKKENYDRIIKDLSNPDKVQLAIVELLDELNKDYSEYDAILNKSKEDDKTINTLRDTNSKLVLRVTEPVIQTEPEVEKTPQDYLEDLKQNILKGGTK